MASSINDFYLEIGSWKNCAPCSLGRIEFWPNVGISTDEEQPIQGNLFSKESFLRGGGGCR